MVSHADLRFEDGRAQGKLGVISGNSGRKADAVLVNTARGGIVDWGALHEARRRGAFSALICFNPHLACDRKGPPDLLLWIVVLAIV